MVQIVDGLLDDGRHLFEVRPVSHAKGYNRQYIAMVACQVLVVVFKQLRILEGDHLAIERFDHGRGIADAFHLSHRVVHLYPVARFDTASHERCTVVYVFDDVLRCKTDTCGEAA